MPITINGTGTIDGISVGGLNDGVITNADIANSTIELAKFSSTTLSTTCRAWVNFDATGLTNGTTYTSIISASYNVSSITYHTTGDFTINFSTGTFADTNYTFASSVTSLNSAPGGAGARAVVLTGNVFRTKTTTALPVSNVFAAASGGDALATNGTSCCVVCFA